MPQVKNGMIGQHVRERLQNDLLATIDKFRRVEGEAQANALLRGLAKQSDAHLADLGFPAEDETADLQMQVMKYRSEAEAARAYANHFGKTLQDIAASQTLSDAANAASRALTWKPVQAESKQAAAE
jgi:hypothetical protein